MFDLELHHIGIAIKYPIKYRSFLKLLGYKILTESYNKIQNVMIQFCEHEKMPRIELIYKVNESKSPIDSFLNNDSQIYHHCYKCNNINDEITKFKQEGYKLLKLSTIDELPWAYYYIKEIGLVEFLEIK